MTPERLRAITGLYGGLRIAVVGDFCLDRYLEIDSARAEVSIETGLPVHNVMRARAQPGAAGTVLNNLAALGVGELLPIGWCGDDGEGYELRRAMAALPGVNLSHFHTTSDRRTFTYCKPLILEPNGSPRELNRLDTKNWTPTPSHIESLTIQSLEQLADHVDAVILLDQVDLAETGTITSGLLEYIDRVTVERPRLRIVGDSRRGLRGWPAVTLKMNAAEFSNLVGRPLPMMIDEVKKFASELAMRQGRDVFVTLAERGIVGATPDGGVAHQFALPVRGEIDIVGAGDAVTANLTAAFAAGANLHESLLLASLASSIVIHKLGTTGTATQRELDELLDAASGAEPASKSVRNQPT
jgi:rfaE bifunctional protein kinase chain/domain